MFPNLVSNERFNQTQSRIFVPLIMLIQSRFKGNAQEYHADSTTIQYVTLSEKGKIKCLKESQKKSKSTMGWFFIQTSSNNK